MMTALTEPDWPVWRFDDVAALGSYIAPDAVAMYGRFPASSDESPAVRLSTIWDVLTALDISYAFAKPFPDSGAQPIRSPGEVLKAPRSGTCLDLALVFAGACMHAGLPAAVVVLNPPQPGQAGHA